MSNFTMTNYANITDCKDCQAAVPAENNYIDDYVREYFCHRKSGPPVKVDVDHWCFEGIPE
jgi:hypothetical protein